MTTVKKLERDWSNSHFQRLLDDLVVGRPEAALSDELRLVPAASAMALIRLDELGQSHAPLSGRLLRTLLHTQEADGGWADPLTTALCVRALLLGGGGGDAIARGLDYLVSLQKEDGAWPAGPIRRLAADAPTTAFILYQLGDQPAFRQQVRFEKAVAFLEGALVSDDSTTRALCARATARCRLTATPPQSAQFAWS